MRGSRTSKIWLKKTYATGIEPFIHRCDCKPTLAIAVKHILTVQKKHHRADSIFISPSTLSMHTLQLFCITLPLLTLHFLSIETRLLGSIANASLSGSPTISIMNGTCQSCLCAMLNVYGSSVVALNCFRARQQCELFANYSSSISYSFQSAANITFYFLELPPIIQSTSSAVTTMPSKIVHYAYWPFDSNFNDFYGVYNGAPVNSANLSSTVGINGYGKALSVIRTSQQFADVASPGFSLVNESFTVEAWVNPGSTMASNDFLIFGQCTDSSGSNPNRCLNIILRSGKPMISFNWGGDCQSAGLVTMSRWSHVAFVHDFDRKTQSVYTNGLLSCFANGSSAYIGGSAAPLRLGGCSRMNMYFNGLIDELVLMTRVKSAAEILEDATLTFRYSFDAGEESYDSGQSSFSPLLFPYLQHRSIGHQWYHDQRRHQQQWSLRSSHLFQSVHILLSDHWPCSLRSVKLTIHYLDVDPSILEHHRHSSSCLVR